MSSSEAAPANVRVLVRVRPFNEREANFNQTSVLEIEDSGMTSTIDFGMGFGGESTLSSSSSSSSSTATTNSATVNNNSSGSQGTISIVDQQGAGGYFTYDAVFGPKSQQIEIFDSIKGIIDTVCAGYNGTIVAYGQTGSGKTHTIFGDEGLQDNNNAGLVQRSLKAIFRKMAEQSLKSAEQSLTNPTIPGAVAAGTIRTSTKASFFEIYNERVYDLLSSNAVNDDGKGLPVREDATKGVYVEGLIEREVANTMDAMDVLRCGMCNRSVASTKMNRVSSRSHAMFVLTVRSEIFSENGTSKVRVSKFRLVDLAGSERQKSTSTEGERLKEASMINNSLLCLGQVINSLVDREKGKQQNHVPFRDTKLTFLLKDSFGGNSKTCLVATCSPSVSSLTETLSTLKFAQRAKLIKNSAVQNENTRGSVAALQAEIVRLRAELETKKDTMSSNDGDQSATGPALSSLSPAGQIDSATVVTVSALRNQNSKLSKKVKVLKDATNHRDTHVNSLKRKLQQETLVRKCKERRIEFLSSKGKTSEVVTDDEIAALREEVTILREQLEAQPSESVEWMLKFKEERAKVEEMEAEATAAFGADERDELEASLVTLLNERDSLQQKVEDMSSERASTIDSIIKDVDKLENSNIKLQSQLDKKELVIVANEDKIQSNEAQIDELQKSLTDSLDCLEATQDELASEKVKTAELQQSVDIIKAEVEEANATVMEYQSKVAAAEEELKKTSEEHNDSTAELNTKITELQNDLDVAMDSNESLMKKLKEASDDLETKKRQLESLERDMEASQAENNADIESFKIQEESFRIEIRKAEETIESLLEEKGQAAETLEKVTAQNITLSGEVEVLKKSLDKLHAHVASLEDEVMFMTVENALVEERLEFTQADLERTTRVQDVALGDELALCDEIINSVSREKSKVQEELIEVSQQLSNNNETIAMLHMNLSELTCRAKILEADKENAEEMAKRLENEKCQTAKQLEEVTAKSLKLDEKISSLKSERDKLQFALDTQVTELQIDLAIAKDDNESLTKKMKYASDDLEAIKTRLESLEHEKSEALTQLTWTEEKCNSDLELFKLHEETLKAEIKKREETVAYLQGKVDVTELELERTTEEHNESTTTFKTKIAELQKVLDIATNDNASLVEKMKEAEENLETKRTQLECLEADNTEAKAQLRLSQEKNNADLESFKLQEETLKAEIVEGVKTIASLQCDVFAAETEMKKMSAEHDEFTAVLDTKIRELQKGLDIATDENESLNTKLQKATDDIETKSAQLECLDNEKNEALEKIDLMQEKSKADLESFKLEEETLKDEIARAKDEVVSLQGKVNAAEEELVRLNNEHDESTTTLNTKITDLQKDLDIATDDNEALTKKMKEASEDIETKQTQLECLEADKRDLSKQLEATQQKHNADLESFKLQEETLKAEISQADGAVKSLQEKVNVTELELKRMTEEHNDSIATLNSKVADLQQGLDSATDDNQSLEKKVKEAEENLEAKQIHLESLEADKSELLKTLESTQKKSDADLESFKLQEETLKAEIAEGVETIASLQSKVEYTEMELEKMSAEHDESTAVLNAENTELQKGLDIATDENESLNEKLKKATDDIETKSAQLESLDNEKSEALEKIDLMQEKSKADLESFKLEEETLKDEIAKGRDEITSLHSTVDSFESELKRMSEEYDESNVAFSASIAELQKDLDSATGDNEVLMKKVKETSDDLTTKAKELESLKFERDEISKQLRQSQETNNADLESFKLERETLKAEIRKGVEMITTLQGKMDASDEELKEMAEEHNQLTLSLIRKTTDLQEGLNVANSDLESSKIQEENLREQVKKAEETVASLLAEKTQASATIDQITAQNVSLSGDMEVMVVGRDSLQRRLASLHDQMASFEDEVQHVTIEKKQVEEKLKFVEADLERTIRLQKESVAAQTAAHENDLAHRDSIIDSLTEEKSRLQKGLAKVSQKLEDNDTESSRKVEMLQNELACTREGFDVMKHKENQLMSELETIKANHAESVAYAAQQEDEFRTKLWEAQSAKLAAEKELGEKKVLLAEKEGDEKELVEAGEVSEAQRDEMKAKIEALEKENASLREKSSKNPPPSPDIPPTWNASPIKPVEEPSQNTTFGADDTFDESMFLPNVNDQTKLNQTLEIKEESENKTPSKTPFKEKRALFSPVSEKPKTPAKRMTRRMTRSMSRTRTPLGKSSVQNTPSSNCKVRTNWSKIRCFD